jgi:hypothetical protein
MIRNSYTVETDGSLIASMKQGYLMRIDAIDTDILRQYSWHINLSHNILSAITEYDTRTIIAHRLIADRMELDISSSIIVHINGDTLDNRRDNLQLSNQMERQKTKSIQSNNKSGVVGVSFNKNRDRWVANIKRNGIRQQKYFKSFEAACDWRREQESIIT